MSKKLIHTNVELHDGTKHHQHQTRARKLLRKPKAKTKYFGTSTMIHKSITAFNNLPEAIKTSKDLWNFKKRIKIHFSSN